MTAKMHLVIGQSTDFPVITCDRCSLQFVLIATHELDDEQKLYSDGDFGFVMPQAVASFCPYCGARQQWGTP